APARGPGLDRPGHRGRRISVTVAAACYLRSGPVTFDWSISIFILSQFEVAGTPLSQQELRNTFIRTYIDDCDQIDRRLREQEISGNLERTPHGWKLTAQGRMLMAVARAVSHLFRGEPRFVGAYTTPFDRGAGTELRPKETQPVTGVKAARAISN